MSNPVKKTVDEWLNDIDYTEDPNYVPSEFALEFVSFIKLVNGDKGEEHKTPVVHYKILDQISGKKQGTLNMCHRGLAKTTVLGEYLFLYIGTFGKLPGFGKVDLALYVSDSIDNGVKNMRKNLEFRWENSEFLKKYIPNIRFTDTRWEFNNTSGNRFIVKGYGAKALSLDTVVIMLDGSRKLILDTQIGDYVISPRGYPSKIIDKSGIFNRPMFKITLEDGRSIKVSDEHLHAVTVKLNPNNVVKYVDTVYTTSELINHSLQHIRVRKRKGKPSYISKENLVFIKNTLPVEYLPKQYDLDPYTLGLLLGDGSMKKDGSNILHAHKDDMQKYYLSLPDNLGCPYLDRRNDTVVSIAIKGISATVKSLGLAGIHGNNKFIPVQYLIGSIAQRIAMLRGLMDTDGSIQKNGRMDFCSNSERLVDNVSTIVRSLGGTTKKRKVNKAFRIEIWINICPFLLPRKANRFTKLRVKPLVAITSIDPIADEPSQCIQVESVTSNGTDEDHHFLIEDYFRTHNTGVRGAKEMGQRPTLAVLDDLISDEDARSDTIISSVEDTVYKAVDYALHPTKSKTIWSGTPFNAKDPLYKAVESGAWYVNVFPVCETFPCTREEFKGSWEDRFDYDYVVRQYEKAKLAGKLDSFNQELMLRIMSPEDRLIDDSDIIWYKRSNVLQNKGAYNFYITTDFATSEKQHADFSVINVWAFNNNGDWMWVDGVCKKVLMDVTMNSLFRLVQEYNPQEVGIEISGQQKGFASWILNEMGYRNCYFTLSKGKTGNEVGINPIKDKTSRFRENAVPLFKSKKIWLPEELKDSEELVELQLEISLATLKGFKSKHDDQLDTITMLAELNTWRPSEVGPVDVNEIAHESGMWANEDNIKKVGDPSYFP